MARALPGIKSKGANTDSCPVVFPEGRQANLFGRLEGPGVLAAVDCGGRIYEAAELLQVSVSYIY